MFVDLVVAGVLVAVGYIWGRKDGTDIAAGRKDTSSDQDFGAELTRRREEKTNGSGQS